MAKRHWLRNGNMACPTKQTSDSRLYGITAERFVARFRADPDRFCTLCAKAARLALAAESAPKPDDATWPKPRPISEAPKDGSILGWVPATDELRAGWELLHYSVSATEWHDNAGVAHEPTHFLPLPPEVR
jgi:hypothetical protein